MKSKLLRIGIFGVLVAGIALAIIYRELFDAAALEAWVEGSGAAAPLVFMLIYALGTVFARDAETGSIMNATDHWTTTLVDPDFAAGAPPVSPELFYTAPIVRSDYIWVIGAVYGRLHLVAGRFEML